MQRLLRDVHRVLAPGGRFVIAFRDFTNELGGDARFIPVRGDERTVFSCFLEYEGDHVRVYDVIHSARRRRQRWEMSVSVYKKLRIGPIGCEKRVERDRASRSSRPRCARAWRRWCCARADPRV